MRFSKSKNIVFKNSSDGSSLAIALFFFLTCSLICVGILFLASSSLRGATKSVENIPESFPYNPDDIPTPIPTPIPTETEEILPEYDDDVVAIDTIYASLSFDYDNAFITAENGGTAEILKNPDKPTVNPKQPVNPSYEILSYIHSNYDALKISSDGNEMINQTFTYTISGTVVYAEIEMTGTKGSKSNGGLQFKTFKMTITSADSACPYVQTYDYSAVDNKKVYIKFNGSNSKRRFEFTEK